MTDIDLEIWTSSFFIPSGLFVNGGGEEKKAKGGITCILRPALIRRTIKECCVEAFVKLFPASPLILFPATSPRFPDR